MRCLVGAARTARSEVPGRKGVGKNEPLPVLPVLVVRAARWERVPQWEEREWRSPNGPGLG